MEDMIESNMVEELENSYENCVKEYKKNDDPSYHLLEEHMLLSL